MAIGPVIEQALRLEGEGRALEAIDALTAANRAARDPSIERLLVQVRHRAFGSIGRQDSRYASPDPVNLKEDWGLPNLHASELTGGRVRAAILDRGALIVRNLVSDARVTSLRSGIDHVFIDRAQRGEPDDRAEATSWYEPFAPSQECAGRFAVGRHFVNAGSGVWLADSPRMLFELTEAYEGLAREVVTGYLGERPALSVNKGTLRRVPSDGGTEWWHQDGAFLGSDIRSLNVWLALSDCGEDAPGLEIVPKRLDYIVEKGTRGADFDWSAGQAVVDEISGGAISQPVFAAGDALLFDHLCLHRTFTTPAMSRTRYAIETWFFAPSAYPNPLEQVPLVF